MPVRLIGRSGPYADQVYPLIRVETTIGRDTSCAVVLDESAVSRRHARIVWDGAQYLLSDLGSKNGTFLNGERLVEAAVLQQGDAIGFAGCLFAFDTDSTTAEWQPDTDGSLTAVQLDPPEVVLAGQRVRLTPNEYRAFACLFRHCGQTVSRQQLAEQVWPAAADDRDTNIETVISNVRKKLPQGATAPVTIETRRGAGYRLTLCNG